MSPIMICWCDGNIWLGMSEDLPEFMTQGETLEELHEMLGSLRNDLEQFPELNPGYSL